MPSIFTEEWRNCLRAHYTYVVRNDDRGTERTLRGVMQEAGFNDDELKQLYILATAHVDDVGADFVPDMDALAEEPAPVSVAVAAVAVAVPQEVIEAQLVEEALQHDEAIDELMEVSDLVDDAAEDALVDDEPPQEDPGATQLSLF